MVDFTDKKAFEEAISANMQYSDFYRDNKERLDTFVSYYESCKESARSPQVDEVLQERSEKLWKEYKPSPEAQKVRSELAHRFDIDDNVPDYVWNLVDIAAQAATRPAVVDEDDLLNTMMQAYDKKFMDWEKENQSSLPIGANSDCMEAVIEAIRPYLRTPPDKAATIEKMASSLELYFSIHNNSPASILFPPNVDWKKAAELAYEAEHE